MTPCPCVPFAGPHAWPRRSAGVCRPTAVAGGSSGHVPEPAAPATEAPPQPDSVPVQAHTEVKGVNQEMAEVLAAVKLMVTLFACILILLFVGFLMLVKPVAQVRCLGASAWQAARVCATITKLLAPTHVCSSFLAAYN